MHPADLQAVVTNARDFKAAELKANHVQAINLVMNESSELNQKLEGYLADNCNQSHPSLSTNQQWQQEMYACHYCSKQGHLQFECCKWLNEQRSANLSTANLSATNTCQLSTAAPTHLSTAASDNLSAPTNSNTTTKLTSKWNPKTKIDPTELEIIDSGLSTNLQFYGTTIRILTTEFGHQELPKPECLTLFKSFETNQKQSLTNNILPATVTNNKLLAAIFLFELEETTTVPLFSGAALDTKPIIAMYTDTKVDSHAIKLILNSRSAVNCATSAHIITTDGTTKALIGEIDDFSFEVNGIITPIKVLTNVILDWMMQKLQLSQNSQHTHVPAMCDYFKPTNMPAPLIKFKKEEKKPTWEAYQVSWADEDHNKLVPILSWDDNKEKQKEEPT
ncbi:hypothetical protein G9A89_017527 [Geosiphon pyriformis]|nr:hypothetical protein G9A89_017527 [Geosiphon pyriformis]